MPDQQHDVSSEVRGFSLLGLAATPVGSALDGVLNWSAAPVARGQYGFVTVGSVSTSDYAVVTLSATNGTTIQFTKRGIYVVSQDLSLVGAVPVMAGISLDEGAGSLGSNPTPATVGAAIRRYGRSAGQAAGDRPSINLSAIICVTQAMINAGQGIVRGRATDASDATPTAAAFDLPNCMLQVDCISDMPGN